MYSRSGNKRRKTIDEVGSEYRKRLLRQETIERRNRLRQQLYQRQINLDNNYQNINNHDDDNNGDDNHDDLYQGGEHDQNDNLHDNQNADNNNDPQDCQNNHDRDDNQNDNNHENLNYDLPEGHNNYDHNNDNNHEHQNDDQHDDNHGDDHYINDFKRYLAAACVKTRMSHQQINAVLRAIRRHHCLAGIPRDARTLLSTPRTQAPIHILAGGYYLDLGLENACLKTLEKTPRNLIPRELLFDFSVDGALLDRGQKGHVWPIQIRIANIPQSLPEFVGIWVTNGTHSKPTNSNEFLSRFVHEYRMIHGRDGINFNNEIFELTPRSFIGDAPARAMMLRHKGHSGYSACSRCTVLGIPGPGKSVIFLDTNIIFRDERDYYNQTDHEHHNTGPRSILHRIPGFDVVKMTVFDIMHAVFLGMWKQFLAPLVIGKYQKNLQLDELSIETINARLVFISDYCPREFSRHPDDIKNYSNQKATECRQQLLHTGFVFLRGIIHPAIYTHYLKLATAIKLLVRPATDDEIVVAEKLLLSFVRGCKAIYGLGFYTYNCHVLLHLTEDARRFGPLDSVSAFPYENAMQYFPHTIKKNHQYLQQIRNRHAEKFAVELINNENNNNTRNYIPGKKWTSNNLPPFIPADTAEYHILKCPKFLINLNDRDNTLILHDGSICIVENIIYFNRRFCLLVRRFLPPIKSLFNVGWSSELFGIFKCSKLSNIDIVRIDEVRGKCFRMPYFNASESMPTPNIWVVSLMTSTINE